MFGFLRSLFSSKPREEPPPTPRFTLDDVARRLDVTVARIRSIEVAYTKFEIPKRKGGMRTIHAPNAVLKDFQRTILRRLLRGLRTHPCATGFERGHSIVTNALPHTGKDVVIRLDLEAFFPSIKADRIRRYFRFIGYDEEAAEQMTRLCTHQDSLPQGAPTSPRLSNLVNFRLDTRLAALAEGRGLSYSRYADDITLSLRVQDALPGRGYDPAKGTTLARQQPRANDIIHAAKAIIEDEGYRMHKHRKLRIFRKHDRQMVTGLVVNDRPNLPRDTRRRLRAIEHHLRMGRQATMTAAQLEGWRALQQMIRRQSQSVT